MILQDLFEVGERVGSYLKDLLIFYLAPGSYLRLVAQESGGKTASRMVVYAVLFTLLEVSILSLAVPKIPTGTFFIAGATVVEVTVGLLYVPAFWLVTKFLRVEAPAKTALVYALTFRFAYFLVPILLYMAFLTTEDYGFALLRGVGLYLFLFGYYLMLPLTLAQGVRKRAVASAISVVACVLVFSGIATIFDFTYTSGSRAADSSFLFDPIGTEVDRANVRFDRDTSLDRVVREIHFLVEGKDSLTRTPLLEVQRRLTLLREGWPRTDSTLRRGIDSTDRALRALSDSARFGTTRDLIALQRAELKKISDVLNTIDLYVKQPTGTNYIAILRASLALVNTEGLGWRRKAEYLEVRLKLTKLGLLIHRGPEEGLTY